MTGLDKASSAICAQVAEMILPLPCLPMRGIITLCRFLQFDLFLHADMMDGLEEMR